MQNVHTIVSNILPMTSIILMLYFFVHSVNIDIFPYVCQMQMLNYRFYIFTAYFSCLGHIAMCCVMLCYFMLSSFEISGDQGGRLSSQSAKQFYIFISLSVRFKPTQICFPFHSFKYPVISCSRVFLFDEPVFQFLNCLLSFYLSMSGMYSNFSLHLTDTRIFISKCLM